MKLFSLIALTIMAISFTSCGGKDGGSKSSAFSSAISTQSGYYNTQTQALEVGNQTYPPNQAYAQIMNQAIQQAQAQGIQPILVNGVYKFRAQITGSVYGVGTGYNQNYPYNSSYGQYGQQQLQLTSVVFVR